MDHKHTALEFRCDVAKYSPDGEKSIDRGACSNFIQSTNDPVTISHTLMQQSIDELISHLESG